ncbi:hypothetical protein IM774_12105 [Erysipelotrichaceae bacterium RD49]|nr:hypothetical protein [Erysipelotrichaceae bacterium RD49]
MVKEKLEIEHVSKFYLGGHKRQIVLDSCSWMRKTGEDLDGIRSKQNFELSQTNFSHFDQTIPDIDQDLALAKKAGRILVYKSRKESQYEPD